MAMTFNYFILSLKMALMHVFTAKFIEEQQAMAIDETYDQYVERHLYAFVALRGATEEQVKIIEAAVLEAKEEAKLHVVMYNSVTTEGMGRHINQIGLLTEFWEDNFAS